MKQKIYCLIAGTALCMMALPGAMAQNVDAKTSRQKLRAGNEDYKNEKYTEAEVNYRRSLDADPTSEKAVYNIGNALFRQGKFEEAAKQYQSLTAKERPGDDKKETAADWYNLGNSLYMQEKYAESIEAYKNALRRNRNFGRIPAFGSRHTDSCTRPHSRPRGAPPAATTATESGQPAATTEPAAKPAESEQEPGPRR